jgi:ribose/xylose/arabinose/galactoside ABC-type transport system permease subunit
MNLNNVNSFLQQVVKGLILLIAVALDQWANRRQRRV